MQNISHNSIAVKCMIVARWATLIKKKAKFSSYIGKSGSKRSYMYDLRPPHIWLNICAFPHILGSPSSYMTLQPLPSEYPNIWGKFLFLFSQCTLLFDIRSLSYFKAQKSLDFQGPPHPKGLEMDLPALKSSWKMSPSRIRLQGWSELLNVTAAAKALATKIPNKLTLTTKLWYKAY